MKTDFLFEKKMLCFSTAPTIPVVHWSFVGSWPLTAMLTAFGNTCRGLLEPSSYLPCLPCGFCSRSSPRRVIKTDDSGYLALDLGLDLDLNLTDFETA